MPADPAGADHEWRASRDHHGQRAGALAALAISKYEEQLGATIDPRRVVVVGDTPRDVDCAHAHGCYAFAVATGRYDAAALAAAGADRVVDDLSDSTPLIQTVERLSAGPFG